MQQELIFGVIGGLGLFIFGIKIMSEALKKVAGEKMREILRYLTNNRFSGLGLGAIVTSIIQSSSATTVMVVGFVNAGLMTLVQAIPVILGANIGTTITAQLIAFKLTDYALPIVGVGAALFMFGKKKRTKQVGEAILGFGILFLGLSIMGGSVKSLGSSSVIHDVFAAFSHNPVLGIIIGMIVTAIVQSSSVTTGIILVMAGMGLLDLNGAIPLVFGTNIGTCVTAIIATLRTNITAKRAAVAHVIFNVTGTIIAMLMLPLYIYIVTRISFSIERQIANVHTIFNIVNALIFIGFVPLYAKLINKIVPGEDIVIEQGPKYLDKNLLNTPSIAVDAAKKEILRMMRYAKEMVEIAMNAFSTDNRKDIERVHGREDLVDELRDAIAGYLVKIAEEEISETEAKMIPSFLHSINDIERIADHAENMADLAERKIDEGITLAEEERLDIDRMYVIVKDMIYNVTKAISDLDKELTQEIFRKERELNHSFIKFRENHVNRLNIKVHSGSASIIFVDMLTNFEKIGDHTTNIAQAIQGKFQWNLDDIY
ncbi:MAG: Na/Pi cotransporter family protein [Nanoarchaeota archaeon]|nr:Na/Pi cotransporter family protein [Nanoarchaeota archaeon]